MTSQDYHLVEEIKNAKKLTDVGLNEVKKLDFNNIFYHLPFLLLSSGFERVMKCLICLKYYDDHKSYPDYNFLLCCGGQKGHNLVTLKNKITNEYFIDDNEILRKDMVYISSNDELNTLLSIISKFGEAARYYHLDKVTTKKKQSVDVDTLWEDFQAKLIKKRPSLNNIVDDIYSTNLNKGLNDVIIELIEHFIDGLFRQIKKCDSYIRIDLLKEIVP